MTNNAPAKTNGKNAGFTQAEVKVRNVIQKLYKDDSQKKWNSPNAFVSREIITADLVKLLNIKFKVKSTVSIDDTTVHQIAKHYETAVAMKNKPVPPKRSNTKVKKMKQETVNVDVKAEKDKPLTKIERKIIKIFNTLHNRKGEDRIVRATTQMRDGELTAEFMHALDKEFKVFMHSLPEGTNYTAANIASYIKVLRKAKKERKRLDAEKLITTNVERRMSLVHTFTGIDINSVSGSHTFETDYKFWREFDKWYKKNGKKLRAKPKFKSDLMKTIHSAATNLHAVGAISDLDKARFDSKTVTQ